MVVYVRKWLNRGKFVLVFCLFTYALYHMLFTLAQWIEPTRNYKEPTGKAVKVFGHEKSLSGQGTIGDRLKLFYWMGE